MTDKKRFSRRDAIKLLGAAAGGSLLANLPTKWTKPEITAGVIPAHAQTSGFTILSCDLNLTYAGANSFNWSSTVTIAPAPFAGVVPMKFTLFFTNVHFTGGSDPQSPNPFVGNWDADNTTGIVSQVNSSNIAAGLDTLTFDSGYFNGAFSVLWEFLDPSQGSGTCSKRLAVGTG